MLLIIITVSAETCSANNVNRWMLCGRVKKKTQKSEDWTENFESMTENNNIN
jgi:hypothetical protein